MEGRATMGLGLCFSRRHVATWGFGQERCLKACAVMGLFVLLALFAFNRRAKAGFIQERLNVPPITFLTSERPFPGNTLIVPTLSSHSLLVDSYPNKLPTQQHLEEIPVPSQSQIQKYLLYYQGPGCRTFKKALSRSWPYVSIMSDILRSYGLPDELVYVVLVESRFKNKSLSHKGAGGYWQLMEETARSLGLRVDFWVDERMDPVKSTYAAAQYLCLLYERFHSWPLTLAAYNGGQTALKEAIRKHRTKDFWKLCELRALPEEVRCYVPKVFAAITITKNLELYGFKKPRFLPIYTFDSVRVWNPLELQLVAQWIDISVRQLRALNPSLRRNCLPPGDESFILHIPVSVKDKFYTAYQHYLKKTNDRYHDSLDSVFD